jgi:hypothetical protein
MSHLSTHNTKLNDLDSIRAACDELGLTLTQGGTVKFYYGTQGSIKADYIISWEGGQYDVGLVKDAKTGAFNLVYDEYGNYVESKLGRKCVKLTQSATFHRISKKAKGFGYSITRKNSDNTIQMTLTKY